MDDFAQIEAAVEEDLSATPTTQATPTDYPTQIAMGWGGEQGGSDARRTGAQESTSESPFGYGVHFLLFAILAVLGVQLGFDIVNEMRYQKAIKEIRKTVDSLKEHVDQIRSAEGMPHE